MIRVSTRGRYALRAMVDLARHGDEGPVARRDIAQRQEISADYVAQIFQPLQRAGLVEGVKGPGGGYRLSRDAQQIRVREIVEAVEGPVALAPCLKQNGASDCTRAGSCATRSLWQRLTREMMEMLDSYSLQDLEREEEARGS